MLLRHSPTIDELLGDSLVQAVMLADNVEQQALRTVLTDAATRIATARPEREPGLAKGVFANPGIRGPIGPARPSSIALGGMPVGALLLALRQ